MAYTESSHPLGYTEAIPKPTPEALGEHYANQYFQKSSGSYEQAYTESELLFFKNIAHVAKHYAERLGLNRTLLDLGCGEGFFSAEFAKAGWQVSCCDYSNYALQKHNPSLLQFFSQGELHLIAQTLAGTNSSFGLVNLQNVLEHVIDPEHLLSSLTPVISKENGCIRIKVPNDYSKFQLELLAEGLTENTWFSPPEHLSYFNTASLRALLDHCGYDIVSMQANFPIEIFIANPNSNYSKNRSLGKGAHFARVFCENFLVETDIDAYIAYTEAAGALGWGRELIVFARPR